MLSDLQPMGLHAAAHYLGVDPFDLVRLTVATDQMPANLLFPLETLDNLAVLAGIEDSWWHGVDLPEDKNPLRQRVRAAFQLLLDRGHVGGEGTRMDNVWRGLDPEDQGLVRDAILTLADEGHLAILPSPMAHRITVSPASEERVRQIAAGTSDTSALSALYER